MKRLLLLALPLALAGCPKPAEQAAAPAAPASAPAPETPAPSSVDAPALLPQYHWRLTDANDAQGKRIDALFARADKPVQLDFRDGRLDVSNTCNRMGGSYTLSATSLTVGRLASTLMACTDSALMALDQEVGKRLEGTLKLAATQDDAARLTLTTATGDTLVFKIRVVNTGDYFYSQRSQNADGITHVFSANYGGGDWGIPAGVYVGFEDLYGGGDLDYDDLRFVFTNVGGGEVGGIPEPATWAMLITGFGLVGFAARRRKARVTA